MLYVWYGPRRLSTMTAAASVSDERGQFVYLPLAEVEGGVFLRDCETSPTTSYPAARARSRISVVSAVPSRASVSARFVVFVAVTRSLESASD